MRCVNNAAIYARIHRVGGIVANGTHGQIEACINNGDITVSASASAASGSVAGCRVGGIMAYCTTTSANSFYLKDCVNNGTITVPEASSYVGGVAGLFRTYKADGCINRGNVYAAATTRGLLVGCVTSADSPSVFSGCKIRGRIGSSAADAVEATAGNVLSLGASFASGVSSPTWTAENVTFLAE